MNAQEIIFILIRSAVCGYDLDAETVSELRAKLDSDEEIKQLGALSQKHDLAHIVGYSLEKYGLLDGYDAYAQKFAKKQFTAVYRYEKLNYELSVLTQTLEEGEIDHIPLKGAILREMYPEPWMRTSCDIDVLVHPDDLERAVQYLSERLGYVRQSETAHDVSMMSSGGVHIELHYGLVEDGLVNSVARVLEDAWKNARLADGKKHSYMFSDEMFYFYHISHMAKHFVHGGCGIRPFIDLWILDRDRSNDCARRNLLEEGDLLKFCDASRELYGVWFDGNDHTERTLKMQEYLLAGGVYGNFENLTVVQNRKAGNKFTYVFKRIFAPYEEIKHFYPRLGKHKWMLPLCWIVRAFKLLKKNKAKQIALELRITSEISKEAVSAADKFLCDIGLK